MNPILALFILILLSGCCSLRSITQNGDDWFAKEVDLLPVQYPVFGFNYADGTSFLDSNVAISQSEEKAELAKVFDSESFEVGTKYRAKLRGHTSIACGGADLPPRARYYRLEKIISSQPVENGSCWNQNIEIAGTLVNDPEKWKAVNPEFAIELSPSQTLPDVAREKGKRRVRLRICYFNVPIKKLKINILSYLE